MRDITPPANWSRRPQYGDRSRPLSVRSTVRVETRSRYFDIKAKTITAVEEVETIETVTVQQVPSQSVPELPVEQKVSAMTGALEKARKDLKKEHRKKTMFKRASLILVAAVILLSTGYVGVDTWMTNNRLKAGAESVPASSSTPVDTTQAEEGSDETKPPASALDSYVVSPSLPRALYINKINIAARLMPMNVNTDGSVQAPKNIFDAGWYTSSVKPGEDGAMLVDGHASGATRQGLFGYLDTLTVGDEIQIEKGDGTRLTYKVIHTETVPLKDVDMKKMLLPYGDATKGLNLMTCTGTWIPSEKTYDERALVFAEQV